MYRHKSQSQAPQSFSNTSRTDQQQQPPNQQHNAPASNMLSGFPFPRPTQLPDELESALAIRGARDMDHHLTDHTSRPNQHQNQGTVSVIGQHGCYSTSPRTLTSDNQTSHHHRGDWSNFQPPSKLFASSASDGTYHPQQLQGLHQQTQSNQTGSVVPSWVSSGSSSSQAQQPHCGVGDGQGLYTPESAGSILASFGLSNADLEVLSHYPDDQLTPDTLPFILRDIQINKSDNQNTVARNIHGKILPPTNTSQLTDTCLSEVPSLLMVTKTAGKVIDYGHASRAKECTTKETFKRDKLSSERVVQMYSSASTPKVEKAEKRHIRMVHMESSKHGDRDYRRTSGDHHKSSLSRSSEGPPSKSRVVDKDYRHNGSKQRLSSESRREVYSRRSLSSSSGTSGHNTSKKFPDSTLISDFSGTSPKVFPHSCSLCHIQCDHKKDWVDHINTVNHTAACRDLRNNKSRVHVRPHSPHDHRQHHGTGESPHHSGLKRPYNDPNKSSASTTSSEADQSYKHGPSHSSIKTVKKSTKPGTKTNKTASAKAAVPASNLPPAKKKKKTVASRSQDSSKAGRLVYLTGIPKQASEQEVTQLVVSYGRINNVILMPCSEEESEKGDGQKASVCMVKAADAQALANSTDLTIGEQLITASIAKVPESGQSSADSNRKHTLSPDGGAETKDSVSKAAMNTSAKGLVLITGLPDGDWSESDVIKLIQPFGNPTDIIFAKSVGKALLSVPDVKTAEEAVKVHTSIPAKIKDCELKMIDIKQHIGTDTPVALYNLLMQSLDPLESSTPVSWTSLLVINNVPDTPTGSSEVKQLVQRFGTVVKTLELKNMVICEMATGAMALSVYKRFQRFPCIIQNNPLFFSRKPDPKANTQTEVLPSNLHSSEDILANDEECNTGPADQDERAHEENVSVEMEKGPEILMGLQKVVNAEEVVGENGSCTTHEPRDVLSISALEPHTQTDKENLFTIEAVMKADKKDASADETIMQTVTVNAAELETHVGQDTSTAVTLSEFSKDTPEVHAGATTDPHPNKMGGSANRDRVHLETEGEKVSNQTKETDRPKVVDETKGTVKNHAEAGLKTQERERNEKEARKEKEAKERERNVRERAREKIQRAKWDREQEERTKRERREMEKKKERDVSSGVRSSCRFETYKSNPYMVEQRISNKSDAKLPKMEREDFDSFPLSMSDFVTVDEVGDVTDLNDLLHSPSPAAPAKTTEQAHSLTSVPQDTHEVIPLEVTNGVNIQPMKSDDPVTDFQHQPMKSDDPVTDFQHQPMKSEDPVTDFQHQPMKSEDPVTDYGDQPTTSVGTSDNLSSDVNGMLGCKIAAPPTETQQEFSPVNQKLVPTCQPEEFEKETIPSVPVESVIKVEALPTPISISTAVIDDSTSDDTTIEVGMTSGNNNAEEKQSKATTLVNSPLNDGQTVMLENAQAMEKIQTTEDTQTSLPSDEPARDRLSDIPTINEEKGVDKPVTKETPMATENTLHFDPSIPVGMEFLVPKTGFFCKVCNRFFSGNEDTQITHCKSLKHFENLQKYLETRKLNVTVKPKSSQ
ncbi:zinc finger protein 638-like isoform X2 [Phycodurus eques]|uniref:zinc finger protein 638-like isoform X2 n=1 Tax=Phycodurus eques TaxID=693459 RepID=UPI002ACDC071|nr:zinc finger protein 638-like isoform X2 [Phycodurus eques]